MIYVDSKPYLVVYIVKPSDLSPIQIKFSPSRPRIGKSKRGQALYEDMLFVREFNSNLKLGPVIEQFSE
jgi:hypothetical protein